MLTVFERIATALERLADGAAAPYPKRDGCATLQTVEEVAERLGKSTRDVDRLVSTGKLTRVKLGRAVRFRPADVERLITAGSSTPKIQRRRL